MKSLKPVFPTKAAIITPITITSTTAFNSIVRITAKGTIPPRKKGRRKLK